LGYLFIHYCQVAGYPAAWQYPWHLPNYVPFGIERTTANNICRSGFLVVLITQS
jgi:hypothetical protein